MNPMKLFKSSSEFPKIKTVQLRNGKWLALFKTSRFSGWHGASNSDEWVSAKYIAEMCLHNSEEQAAAAAWERCKPLVLIEEVKKAMK